MAENTGPIWDRCVKKIAMLPTMYRITMKGTIFSVTFAIRFRPPTTTRPTSTVITRPVTQVGTPKTVFPNFSPVIVVMPSQ